MKYLSKLFVLLMLASFRSSAQSPVATIPDFTFFKLNKTPFTNKDLQPGKASFFVFFDSDCEHCQRAISKINKDFRKFKNAAVYLISVDDKIKITHFMSQYGSNIQGKNITILQDPKNNFLLKFKPRKYPSMFLYDRQAKLIVYEDNEDSIFRIINQL